MGVLNNYAGNFNLATAMCKASPEGADVTEDIVDSFYRDLVQPLGNLVILFAQAEASLVDLVIALDGSIGPRDAQQMLRADGAKQQVVALAQTSGLVDFELTELLNGIDQYWADKDARNRYIHDEWFVVLREGGIAATRGLPIKKGSGVVWDQPRTGEVWNLAKQFRDHHGLFSYVAYRIRRDREFDAG
jgi:hypothetical protein